ncbi:helix-turn-helix transcriptional regulator [Sanguibacter sp. 25GB23B1]|uniref:helix-turn-helix transcriptional regulator n=1 Tax=unclassified Sanguibacter TaxID=2645534 RepID=UPI0032B0106D
MTTTLVPLAAPNQYLARRWDGQYHPRRAAPGDAAANGRHTGDMDTTGPRTGVRDRSAASTVVPSAGVTTSSVKGSERGELATVLRAWRDRVLPEDVGLPAGRGRRARGLRREELGALAGLSVDYVVRLEQGRAANPSAQVVSALARALRLSTDERDHLYRVAGLLPPGLETMPSHVTPGTQCILDRLGDIPAAVFTADWTAIAWNPLWAALLGDLSTATQRERNTVWRHFTAPETVRVVRDDGDAERLERALVADLRVASGRYPRDRELRSLVDDLRAASPRFAELWERGEVAVHESEHKTIAHPEVGRITLDCDVLLVQGGNLRIVAYTVAPRSDDAAKLDLLRVTGTQSLAAACAPA